MAADLDTSTASEGILCYKLRTEKSSGGGAEISLLEWSPTMDVIAIAFTDRTIVLNRLSWQRVWSIEPAKSDVTCLSWRPDGRVLSVGFSDGRVALYSIEDGACLHETVLVGGGEVTSMDWKELQSNATADPQDEGADADRNQNETGELRGGYPDHSVLFFPGLPDLRNLEDANILDPSNRCFVDLTDKKKLKTLSKLLHVLIIGDNNGRLHFCVAGIFYSAIIPTHPDSGRVISTCISPDLRNVDVLIQNDVSLEHAKFDMSIFLSKKNEFQYMAAKYGQIDATVQYMEDVVQAMADAWEDGLLTVDRKLAKYSQTLPDNLTVADEFIILLGCGKARAELQKFLVDELTAGGVKKLGMSLEMSYNTIRMYLINHNSRAIQLMDCYLYEILGMANWTDRFADLGLTKETVQEAIQNLGSFALKAQELLFLLDQSLRYLKVFFTWLYTIILKLSGDSAAQSLGESFTIEDLGILTEFLNNRFNSNTSVHDQTFSLERVGQYFVNEDLKFIVNESNRDPSLLEKVFKDVGLNQENVPWILKSCPEKSLRQLFQEVKLAITNVFDSTKKTISSKLSSTSLVKLASQYERQLYKQSHTSNIVHIKENNNMLISYYPIGCHDIVVVCQQEEESSLQVGRFYISNMFQEASEKSLFRIVSLSYYNAEYLSVLFTTRDQTDSGSQKNRIQSVWSGVAQLPLSSLFSIPMVYFDTSSMMVSEEITELVPQTDIAQYLKQVHNLHKFVPSSIASFSGSRKLAAVVSMNYKRVQLFDVDFDEDEELEKEESSEDDNL